MNNNFLTTLAQKQQSGPLRHAKAPYRNLGKSVCLGSSENSDIRLTMLAYEKMYFQNNHHCMTSSMKSSVGVAPEVNLRHCVSCRPTLSVKEAAHSGYKTPRGHHQKSKTGVSNLLKIKLPHYILYQEHPNYIGIFYFTYEFP